MSPVRLGIVGCGRATTELHLPALGRVPEVQLVALADVDRGRLERAVERRSVARHADAAALVDDPAVEMVAVCTPPGEHRGPALSALDAGKHLFVEKPLALSPHEAGEIAGHPACDGVTAAAGFNLRCHRFVRALRHAHAEGALGPLQVLRTSWTAGRRLSGRLPPWRGQRETGGGVLWEMGVHHFDLWSYLLDDRIEWIHATARSEPLEDDAAVITGRTAGGVLVETTLAQGTSDSNELELVGERGRLRASLYRADGLSWEPVGRLAGGPAKRLRELGGSLATLPRQAAIARRGGDYRDSFRRQWRALARAVSTGARPPAGLDDGRRAVVLATAAAAAAGEGRPVRVGPTEGALLG